MKYGIRKKVYKNQWSGTRKIRKEGEEKSMTNMNEEVPVNDGKEGENGHMLGTWVT